MAKKSPRKGPGLFERHHEPLLPWPIFLKRVGKFAGAGLLLLGVSWLIGILGYHIFEGLPWIESTLNAAMILGGMGPVDPLKTDVGKIFASLYALFSGIVFLVAIGVLAAPIFHRVLHQFHIDPDEDDDETDEKA